MTATPAITEAEWQGQVVELARILGWRSMHVRRSVGRRQGGRGWQTVTSIDGWPDLVLYRPASDGRGELLFAELKSERGRPSAAQERVLADLELSGQEVHVWRPSDLDAVKERLSRHRRAGR